MSAKWGLIISICSILLVLFHSIKEFWNFILCLIFFVPVIGFSIWSYFSQLKRIDKLEQAKIENEIEEKNRLEEKKIAIENQRKKEEAKEFLLGKDRSSLFKKGDDNEAF
jgi:Ca2+/Na+ antiporter